MSDEKTVGEAANRLVDGIEALTRAAEKVAPQAWEMTVSAHRTHAIFEVVGWLFVLAIAAAGWKLGLWTIEKEKRDHSDLSGLMIGAFLGAGILTAIAVGMAGIGGADTVSCIINPEYYAAKELMWAVSR